MDLEKNHSMFTYIAESSRMISAAERLLWPAAPARSEIGVVFPRSSWMWDWTSTTIAGLEFEVAQPQHDTGYMAAVYGLFRLLSQRQNIALDLLAENELTDAGLKTYKALILTQPDRKMDISFSGTYSTCATHTQLGLPISISSKHFKDF